MEEMEGGWLPFFSSDPFRKQAWPREEGLGTLVCGWPGVLYAVP